MVVYVVSLFDSSSICTSPGLEIIITQAGSVDWLNVLLIVLNQLRSHRQTVCESSGISYSVILWVRANILFPDISDNSYKRYYAVRGHSALILLKSTLICKPKNGCIGIQLLIQQVETLFLFF